MERNYEEGRGLAEYATIQTMTGLLREIRFVGPASFTTALSAQLFCSDPMIVLVPLRPLTDRSHVPSFTLMRMCAPD